MDKRTTLDSPTTAANLRTRSTGTVHAATSQGEPLCPTRVTAAAMEPTSAPVDCRSCVKLQTVTPQADIIALTGDQLDGIACIRCHATDAPMVPAGVGERGQLFECTDHTAPPAAPEPTAMPCPPWCESDDHGGDSLGERVHWSTIPDVPLSLEASADGFTGPVGITLMADLLVLDDDTRGTHISLSENAKPWRRRLTLAEADQLAGRLRDLTARARTNRESAAGRVTSEPGPLPYWQTAPCPAWCENLHTDRDHPADRIHFSPDRATALTQERGIRVAPDRWAADELALNLRQNYREDEPVIRLRRGDLDTHAVTMTLAEAEQLRLHLAALLAEARIGEAAIHAAPGCAPWCVRHDDCTSNGRHPADPHGGMCWAPAIPTPGGRSGSAGDVELTYDAEDGALIQVNNDSDAVLTVDEAEEFARAILAQVELARTTVPVTPAPLELKDGEGDCSDPACRICKPA
ncbi:DUF6907 domain-containing protein [Streptosporangium canum]|uniref:DUF6907 domain-containing protein n=1 Tax=Streptosporangium canum TaxID=324952 RepID=UPI0036740857